MLTSPSLKNSSNVNIEIRGIRGLFTQNVLDYLTIEFSAQAVFESPPIQFLGNLSTGHPLPTFGLPPQLFA